MSRLGDIGSTGAEIAGIVARLRHQPIGEPRTLAFLETAEGYAQAAAEGYLDAAEGSRRAARRAPLAVEDGVRLLDHALTDETLPAAVRVAALDAIPILKAAPGSWDGFEVASQAVTLLRELAEEVRTGRMPASPGIFSHGPLPDDRAGRVRVLREHMAREQQALAAARVEIDEALRRSRIGTAL